jgi:TRAP-type mannitol/chloroaromatic compound transport system permease large subunit
MDSLYDIFTAALVLAWWQQLGLAFLLGSFSVATLSDLKYLAAQQEFREVWLLFLLAIVIVEAYDLRVGKIAPGPFAVKWGLIALLSLLSCRRVGVLFRLAAGDVAALAAAASLLPPLLILVLYGLAKAAAWLVERFWLNRATTWPFMPVVSLATLLVLVIGWLGSLPRPAE